MGLFIHLNCLPATSKLTAWNSLSKTHKYPLAPSPPPFSFSISSSSYTIAMPEPILAPVNGHVESSGRLQIIDEEKVFT